MVAWTCRAKRATVSQRLIADSDTCLTPLRFIDLFAGLGGFHRALASLGYECVFASEKDPELQDLYRQNFPATASVTYGDLRISKQLVPEHDILCAGFPCQPFSKSGYQRGRLDVRGTLFDEIVWILRAKRPPIVLLENVGNFERHDGGQTWHTVKSELEQLGYHLQATMHCTSGGRGLISPHHIGHPHHRERFYCVATLAPLTAEPFAPRLRECSTALMPLVQPDEDLSLQDRLETAPSAQQSRCIAHWQAFLAALPMREVTLPSFPIWGDELWATYPFQGITPARLSTVELAKHAKAHGVIPQNATRDQLLAMLPSYARADRDEFEPWKVEFIRKNRAWLATIEARLPSGWTAALRQFPASLRKLEWNCQGEERDIYRHVLQFRPSGLRVKRMTSSPALVAMTATQIPFLGPAGRFLTRVEGLRLQGFPDNHLLPHARQDAFQALGNAVHVDVVRDIADRTIRASPPAMLSATAACSMTGVGVVHKMATGEASVLGQRPLGPPCKFNTNPPYVAASPEPSRAIADKSDLKVTSLTSGGNAAATRGTAAPS